MKLLQTIVFLASFAPASAKKLPNIHGMEEEKAPRQASVRRRAKKDGNSNGDAGNAGSAARAGGYDSCVSLEDVPSGIIEKTAVGDACLTENACNTGCCRLYNFLICDEENDFFGLECVCNDFVTAQMGQVIPIVIDEGDRTDTVGGVIDLPTDGAVTDSPTYSPTNSPIDEDPVVLPISPDACVNEVNQLQAGLIDAGFQGCEYSSECESPNDCCAPSICICGPYKDTVWGCLPV